MAVNALVGQAGYVFRVNSCHGITLRNFATKPKVGHPTDGGSIPDLSAAQSSTDHLPEFLTATVDTVESAFGEDGDLELNDMTEEQKREIPGLLEYELALKFEEDNSYDEAELAIKEALKQIKAAGDDKMNTYIFLMKKLAHVSFLNNRFSESEKYFKVALTVAENTSQASATQVFANQRNLVAFYLRTNIQKARLELDRMKKDGEGGLKMLPIH